MILPGETENVTVRFINSGRVDEYLSIGRIWWIHEGPRKLGEALIIEIMETNDGEK